MADYSTLCRVGYELLSKCIIAENLLLEQQLRERWGITLGYMQPVGRVAMANDESNSLLMLRQRPEGSFTALPKRLDHAIERAVEIFESELRCAYRFRREGIAP